jgi:hypothetical protein
LRSAQRGIDALVVRANDAATRTSTMCALTRTLFRRYKLFAR